ncbi:MAG TPA: LytTR family DNA-binding domain-containing protein [Bacteroidia bacterium]|nr:LytTR family DNA-binding domain-containing protein [Bacteroidia bacterium]
MISALIVDDEKKNRDSLRKLIAEYCPEVNVAGEASSVEEARVACTKLKPDLVFLDVEMPKGSGFDLLRQFDPIPFKVIFVTAHSHYAIKAIRFAALDYLLKPVDTDDLIAAVKKATTNGTSSASVQYKSLFENLNTQSLIKLAIPIRDGFAFLSPDEIIRLQADGTYTHLFTKDQKYTGARNIKEYEQMLSDHCFFRSHHSHLINLKHVKKFSRLDGYFVEMSDGSQAEISRRKKEEFIELMSRK